MAKKKAAPETAAKEEKKIEEEKPAEEAKNTPESAECEALKKELAETHDRLLRTLAEFDNFKKRTAREKEELYAAARGDVVKHFLPIIDNFERAEKWQSAEDFASGVKMILKSFGEVLEKMEIRAIGCAGEEFDPVLHEAVMREEGTDYPENTITEVLQKGYAVGDKVIRHAMVKVSG